MKIIRQVMEFFELIWIGFGNLLYNWAISLHELLIFGRRSWWWKIRYYYFTNYYFMSIRKLVMTESNGCSYSDDNFIYGETPCITLDQILNICGCRHGDLFIDLGCGRGKAVFYAHYCRGLEARGFELLPSFVRRARKIKSSLGAEGVSFFEMDLLDADISNADVIFCAGTTFDDDFIGMLREKLGEAKKGAVIITISYCLKEKKIELFRESRLPFTWGISHVYFHRKK